MRVASVGDSLSTPHNGDPSWVEQAAAAVGAEVVTQNTTPGGQAGYLRRTHLAGALAAAPDVLVLLVGTNDVVKGNPFAPAWVVAASWWSIRRSRVQPLLCSLPPHDRLAPRARLARAAFNAFVRGFASATGSPFVELSLPLGGGAGWRQGLGRDASHPSPQGVRAMAAELEAGLRLVKPPARAREV